MRKPSKPKSKRKKVRPTAPTIHHPEGAKLTIGSDERLLEKKRLAYQNRINGLDNIQNALAIQKELELTEPIPISTLSRWINDEFKERRGELADQIRQELLSGVENLKDIVHRFLPMAKGKLHIRKIEEDSAGEMVEIIDEKPYLEQIKAADLVGKTLLRIRDLLVGTHGNQKDQTEDGIPGGLKSFQLNIYQDFRSVIYDGKKKDGIGLTLEAGEGSVDA